MPLPPVGPVETSVVAPPDALVHVGLRCRCRRPSSRSAVPKNTRVPSAEAPAKNAFTAAVAAGRAGRDQRRAAARALVDVVARVGVGGDQWLEGLEEHTRAVARGAGVGGGQRPVAARRPGREQLRDVVRAPAPVAARATRRGRAPRRPRAGVGSLPVARVAVRVAGPGPQVSMTPPPIFRNSDFCCARDRRAARVAVRVGARARRRVVRRRRRRAAVPHDERRAVERIGTGSAGCRSTGFTSRVAAGVERGRAQRTRRSCAPRPRSSRSRPGGRRTPRAAAPCAAGVFG